ncbi:SDR family NAD(P)-dependent oxidoreductase [Pseudomonas helleri]|uniref:SDR family NAD(P)-dependent oxidoreductase n=1 Tax=Pseudomonas helleri TaxID=1608996 RepID=UPI000653D8FF|nr:SDR family oxidoreductase [Pseudomonas helleri]KMN23395.1 3-oxoacyl-ACP reductase [Pseudomonas helleri]
MNLNLRGKLVVITGGSKGIGLACARAFGQEQARVVIVSRTLENIEAALKTLEQDGIKASGFAAHLSVYENAVQVIADIEAQHGPVDILINSAGAAKRYDPQDLDGQALRAGMEDKYYPVINSQQAVLVVMRARGQGVIVNIIGSGGKVPTSTHLSGGAANAALMLATVGAAEHYAAQGIRINAITPGYTLTGRVEQSVAVEAKRLNISPEEALARGVASVPLGRYGKPEEVADAALFLASDRASYIVGAILPVNGGRNPVI